MEQFVPNIRDPPVNSAIKRLLTYSLCIIFVPLASMFVARYYFFERALYFDYYATLTGKLLICRVPEIQLI